MDPDQLASEKPADLNLHCFSNRIYPGQHGKDCIYPAEPGYKFPLHSNSDFVTCASCIFCA